MLPSAFVGIHHSCVFSHWIFDFFFLKEPLIFKINSGHAEHERFCSCRHRGRLFAFWMNATWFCWLLSFLKCKSDGHGCVWTSSTTRRLSWKIGYMDVFLKYLIHKKIFNHILRYKINLLIIISYKWCWTCVIACLITCLLCWFSGPRTSARRTARRSHAHLCTHANAGRANATFVRPTDAIFMSSDARQTFF